MNVSDKASTVPHPRANANVFSALTLWWTHKIFRTGLKREIEIEDLYEPLKEHKSSLLGDSFERLWKKEIRRSEKRACNPNFGRVMIKRFILEYLLYGLIRGCLELFVRVVQPLFLGLLLQYFTPGSTMPVTDAYLYATGLVSCSLVTAMVVNPYMVATMHLGLKLRIACCSLLYRKALRLSRYSLGKTAIGHILTLMANDVQRFEQMFFVGHYLWMGPLGTAVVTYLIWTRMGIAAFAGIVTMLLFIPLQGYLGKLTSKFRYKTALRTDDRMQIMSEIISGIQVIKMYAWEKPFSNLVAAARKKEMNAIRAMQYVRSVIFSMNLFVSKISIFVSILIYALLDEDVTADKVFVLTAYYNIIRHSMGEFFPKAIATVAEGFVSLKRVETFLILEEIKDFKFSDFPQKCIMQNGEEKEMKEKINPYLNLINVTAKWQDEMIDNTLTGLNFEAVSGRLLAIIGPVGAGKTSVLQAIIGELPLLSGSIIARGRLSYSPQEPWLFAASLRQNILFGEPFDREWYREVVKCCALEEDFTMFPYHDKTLVGDRGVMLSGGQKARVCLARAVYRRADIYLLDDPLSAVDPHVAKHLFEVCIKGLLNNKICILVTHQLQFLHHADEIIILQNGKIDAKGSFSQLQQSGLDFAKLLNSDEEGGDEKSGVRSDLNKKLKHSVSVEDKPAQQQEGEMRSSGGVKQDVYLAYFLSGGNWCLRLIVIAGFILTPVVVMGGEYWLAYWTNTEDLRIWMEKEYINSTSDNISSILLNSTLSSTIENRWMPSRETCIYIYSAIIVAIVIIPIVRTIMFFVLCTNASMRLHNQMFSGISRATMHFFNNNPAGRILNRFSKDIGSVDEMLPLTVMDCCQIFLTLVGVIATVAVVNYWMLIPTVFLGIIFWYLRYYFLATSQSIKRLESITRSPVFSHVNASLKGLSTIRSFGAQNLLKEEFDHIQDLNSSAFYISIGINRAFGLWLDLICIVYLAIVTYSFLFLSLDTFGGSVGLAITQTLGVLGMFQWGVRQSAELVNQMTSVERVLELARIKSEPPLETPPDKKPQIHWPSKGEIEFRHVFLKYNESDPPVLKNLCFTIEPQEKVGIVGRTGAGKSSLLAALFRMTYLEGEILIDNIDTQLLGLHDFRSKISIIPQEPVLFSGSLRKNLDPFNEYSDDILWQALEEVELKEVISEAPGGLSMRIAEGGSNFSVGQRQLVCLARAVIRKNKILVMDEATANVDPAVCSFYTRNKSMKLFSLPITDVLIQRTVRHKFSECTVLTIAHRLHTVMDSDKVLVMDTGCIVEFDHPYHLLQKRNGLFRNMVDQLGKVTAEDLQSIAHESFNNKIHHNISKL